MRTLFEICLFCFLSVVLALGDVYSSEKSGNDVSIAIEKYNKMPLTKLLEMGDYFMGNNRYDSAVICYQLIYTSKSISPTIETQQIVCKALNRAATICFYNCDYRLSLELLLKALTICESIGYMEYISRIYNNIGNVYYQFMDYKSAKKYYDLAYKYSTSNYSSGAILNNLGMIAYDERKLDSALLLYRKAHRLKNEVNDSIYNELFNNIGMVCRDLKQYDSAFYYYMSALNNARKCKLDEKEAKILSSIGILHFDLKHFDSARFYFVESNAIANKSKLLDALSSNYLYFSKMEEMQGNLRSSLDYYKNYSSLKDSLFDSNKYATINELQFTYDMGKVDKHIEELNIEQEIKDRTITMQRKSQMVMLIALLIVITLFVMVYRKNKNLNTAYNKLVSKNVAIVNFDKITQQIRQEYEDRLKEKDLIISQLELRVPNGEKINANNERLSDASNNFPQIDEDTDKENSFTKYKDIQLRDDSKNELAKAILNIMSKRDVFCNPDFSLTALAEMVNSNSSYVSYIINSSLGGNFRTFINDYRIKEACKLLSDPSNQKYSIETIATMVGFKSKSTFNPIFKEITGVTPSLYVKFMKSV